MPARDFLDDFLPVNCDLSFDSSLFKIDLDVEEIGLELPHRLTTIIDKIMADYTVQTVCASDGTQSAVDHIPDIVSYLKENALETNENLWDLTHAELCHHIGDDDLWPNNTEDDDPEDSEDSGIEKEGEEEGRSAHTSAIHRVYICLVELYRRQHRTHAFHVFMTAKIARLLRVDNSGLIVSEPIELDGDSSLLQEFYWRFSHAPADMRGHDPTVRRATEKEAALALKALYKDIKDYKFTSPFHVFEVPNPVRSSARAKKPPAVSRVVASAPIPDIIGRAARTYPAYDLDRRKVLFLKDNWRQDDDDHEKESDILRELHRENVQHIPVLFAGDDVPGRYQKTLSHTYSSASWRSGDTCEVSALVHHRVLQEFLPNCIMKSKTAHILMSSAYDSLLAHQQAYEKCGILHRGIGINSILIKEGSGGVLSDWDLAIRVRGPDGEGLRTPRRQGPFRFMSSFLSADPDKVHDLQDDLQSYLWVVLYSSLSLLPYTTTFSSNFDDLDNIIFNKYVEQGNRFTGGFSKPSVIAGSSRCLEGLDFPHHKPLLDWWDAARDPFFYLQQHRDVERRNMTRKRPLEAPFPTDLADHSYLISITRDALAQPGWSDVTKDSLPRVLSVASSSNGDSTSASTATASEKRVQDDANSDAPSRNLVQVSPPPKESTPVARRTRSRSKMTAKAAETAAAESKAAPQTRSMTRKSATNLKDRGTGSPRPVARKQITRSKSTRNLRSHAADSAPPLAQKQTLARKSTRDLRAPAADLPQASKPDTRAPTKSQKEPTKKVSTAKQKGAEGVEEVETSDETKNGGKRSARKRGRA